jgi:D-tyrosyl-tRNA(Tyr) deacylase
MRVVIQRVSECSVKADGVLNGKIGHGIMILLGVEHEDNSEDIAWLVPKILKLRIFDDENGVMNKSVLDVDGGILVVSQFTLHATTKKGNRPSYIKAARPEQSVPLYEEFVKAMGSLSGKKIETGIFGAHMDVSLVNDGPVTILIDTKNKE